MIHVRIPEDRRPVKRIQCLNRLRSLGGYAFAYASANGGRLPVAENERPRAFQSLQLLVDARVEKPDTLVFVCPGSDEGPAIPAADGSYTLTEKNVSYAWIAQPTTWSSESRDERPLACDNSLDNHDGRIAVLYMDGSAGSLSRQEIEEKYGGFEAFLEKNGLTR